MNRIVESNFHGTTIFSVWNLSENPFTNSATLYGHSDRVLSLTVKDRTAFTGSTDKSIFVWNLNDYEKISSFEAHKDQVCALTCFDNHLYSSSKQCFKIWDIERLEFLNEIQTDDPNCWLRVLMRKENSIYAGCRRVIKVFDALTHQISFEFELPNDDSIYSLAHSENLLFAGAKSGFIYVWDIRGNRCLETMHQHKSTVYGLCTVSVDPLSQQHLISASSDQSVRLWSIDTFEEIQCDDRHKSEVTALHANFRHIMSGGADAKIKVWDFIKPSD